MSEILAGITLSDRNVRTKLLHHKIIPVCGHVMLLETRYPTDPILDMGFSNVPDAHGMSTG